MSILRIVFSLAILPAACSADERASPYDRLNEPDKFESLVTQTRQTILESMEEHEIPGVAVAVVDRDGILWREEFGNHPENGKAITGETIFSVQSISKTYTATTIMLAVQDGLVDLDAPVSRYLPEFSVNTPFGGKPAEQLTLRHLLSHTAGLTHETPVGNNFNAASPSFDAHVQSISKTWLRFPVGDRFAYSNLGVDLAAYIIQERSGIPFETYMKERLLKRIGATSSFVDTPEKNGNCEKCTPGYDRTFSSLPDYIPLTASGGVRSNTMDAARFIRFHLNRGEVPDGQLLEAEHLDEMYMPTHVTPDLFGEESGLPPMYHGLGVYSFPEADTYAINHNGTGFGYLAAMKWYPEYGVGMVILFNSTNHALANWTIGWNVLEEMVERNIVKRVEDQSVPGKEQHFSALSSHQPPAEGRTPEYGEPTPFETDWQTYLGRYEAIVAGGFELAESFDDCYLCIAVEQRERYMYVVRGGEEESLVEHEEKLFFSEASGEVLDFRDDIPTWRNIPLRRAD